MGIKEIEQAISELSPEELVRFREWYQVFDAEIWDQQIESDASGGKLDKLAEEAVKEYKANQFKEL
jgi:hypothetical protein